jgi:Glycosyl transferase family 2
MLALRLTKACSRQFGVDARVLLGGPGVLESAFSEVAIVDRPDGGFADLAAWRAVAERLRAEGSPRRCVIPSYLARRLDLCAKREFGSSHWYTSCPLLCAATASSTRLGSQRAVVPYLDLLAMSGALCQLLRDARSQHAVKAGLARFARDLDFAGYAFDLLRLAQPGLRKVSVVVPNYNYGRHLRMRLESIWRQTYPVYELIVLDDASTDDSQAVLEELQRTTGRQFQIVLNTENSESVMRQWARGVELARGELVWIAEADDFADPDFLSSMVAAFDDPQVVLSYCQSRQVDETGAVMAEHYLDPVADVDEKRWLHDYRCVGTQEIAEALSPPCQ